MTRRYIPILLLALALPALAHAGDPCEQAPKLFTPIAVSSATTLLIQAGITNRQVVVCGYTFTLTGTSTPGLQFVNAVNTPCASTTPLTGAYGGPGVTAVQVSDPVTGAEKFIGSTGQSVCAVVSGGAANANGIVEYIVQ